MTATVALDERLDAATGHRVGDPRTEAEHLACRVIARMDSLAAKLRDLESDIRQLWVEFDKLQDGETILGCATKKEFCEKKLHRTPRAIQYLLAGQSNPADRPHKPSELSSPDSSCIPTAESSELESPAEPKPERTLEDVLDKLVHRIAIQPYGYYAAKFAKYPEQHTTDLAIIEGTKLDIWQRIVEIAQAKLQAQKRAAAIIASLENIGS